MSRPVELMCDVDIEQTPESFHAHAVPDGIDIRPGDVVIVHDAPSVAFGEQIHCRCAATLIRANWLTRAWTEFSGLFALTGLYEVGFEAKDAHA